MGTKATNTLRNLSTSKTNVSTLERIVMITSGAYLLYDGVSKNKKCIGEMSAGGAMLLRGISGYCPLYDALNHFKNGKGTNVNIRTSSVVNRPISEVYAFWRDLENLPKFMTHLESVEPISYTTSKWTAKGPAGIGKLSWKAEILKDEKERLISWHSMPDSTIHNSGKVVFKPRGKATQIEVNISYHAPLGKAGEVAARLFNPYFEELVRSDIMNFKSYLESVH